MTTATARVAQTGSIWSAIIEWPFGYKFISGVTLGQLVARIDAVERGLGRRIEIIQG